MHKEQTNKQTNFLLYIYRLAEIPDEDWENLIQSWYMYEKQVLHWTTCSRSWPAVGSPLGAPLQKLFVGSSGKQCASIEVRCNDKYNWFKLFFTVPIDRENPDRKLCSVLFESRWILIFSEDRLTDWLLCDSDFSSNLRRLFLWSKGWPTAFWTWQIVYPFPVGYCQTATFSRRKYGISRIASRKGFKCSPLSPSPVDRANPMSTFLRA